MVAMRVTATLDASANHPFIRKVRSALVEHNDPSRYLDIEGYRYLLKSSGIEVKLQHLMGDLPIMLRNVPILEVQVWDSGPNPSPRQGYYRSARAEGWVRPVKVDKDSYEYDPYTTWNLELVAPTFDEAKQLYVEMRHSQAQPARGWNAEDNVPAGDLSPLDTLSPYASAEHKTSLAILHLKRLLERGEISMNDLIMRLSQSNL